MTPELLIGGATALGGLASNVISAIQNHYNLQQQQAVLDWQKQAQETTWQREDTAVQRRAKDLEAAGLSKTLAAGSAASTSSPIQVTAPQSNFQYKAALADALQNSLSAARQFADIESVKAQALKLRQETDESKARTLNFGLDYNLKQNELSLFDLRKIGLERDNALKQMSYAKSEQERDLLKQKVANYDKEIEYMNLRNDFQRMSNAQFMRDFQIMLNTGVSSKDLGTDGVLKELIKSAKQVGNKIDLWSQGYKNWFPGMHYEYANKK